MTRERGPIHNLLVHPIVYTLPDWLPIIGGANVYAYGIALGTAFIAAWYLGLHLSNREGIPYKATVGAYGLTIVCSLLGARVAELIANPDPRGLFVAIFASKCEGLVAYGGYIGGTLASWAYMRLKKLDFWSLADCTTPSMVLGLGITRIGCFFAGCCHGQPTDLAWGVSFPPKSPAATAFGALANGWSVPVHPTQIYESLLGFVLFPIALLLFRRRRFTGQCFLVMIPLYAVGRFLLELIRGDTDRGTVMGLSTSQFIGVALVLLVAGLYLWRRKAAPAPPQPLSKEEVEKRLVDAGVLKRKKAGKDKKEKKAKGAKPGEPGAKSIGKEAPSEEAQLAGKLIDTIEGAPDGGASTGKKKKKKKRR